MLLFYYNYQENGNLYSMNRALLAVGILGATAVALGAFGAHAIAPKVTPKDLETWKTASHYHLIHAVALLALVLSGRHEEFKVTYRLWWIGTLIFGGTLYALVLTGVKILGAITPIGGVCLIVGWLLLAKQPNAN